MKPRFYDEAGHPLELGLRIGKGGEGAVHEIAGDPGRVAKIYFKAPSAEHGAKLLAMARLGTPRLLRLAAWPLGTIRGRGGPSVVGLLMPRVSGKPIHLLYSPKSRLDEFPEATWAFLLAAATNVARAMAAVHEHGHVIGDVNHGNILVAANATVHLIDCDSFQIHDGERIFLCDVGVGPYVPPELQLQSLHRQRSPNHDAFGLAVLVFQLLFLGRHPFSGRFLGPGDLPIEQAIHEFRFAYGAEAARVQMQPPPLTPPLTIASPAVAALFERAFGRDGAQLGGRPTAAEWITALGQLATELRTCVLFPAHQYWRELPNCPWCPLELASRMRFFEILRSANLRGTFDVRTVWKQIESVPAPAALPPLALLSSTPAPTREAIRRKLAYFTVVPLVYFTLASLPGNVPEWGPGWLWAAAGLAILGLWQGIYRAQRDFDHEIDASEKRLERLRGLWPRLASGEAFTQRRNELERHCEEYEHLPELRQRRLAELKTNLMTAQRRQFLRRFTIDRARPLALEPGLCATLRSFGIETADDLDAAALSHVPLLPPGIDLSLLSWRYALERRFRFDPSGGTPRGESALEQELDHFRRRLEDDLQRGVLDLRQVCRHVEHERIVLRSRIDDAVRAVAQAKANRAALYAAKW